MVDGVSFACRHGGSLGIVGESGSGKSMTLRAVMGLLPRAAQADAGTRALDGEPLPLAGSRPRDRQRRRPVAMVFQDSLARSTRC